MGLYLINTIYVNFYTIVPGMRYVYNQCQFIMISPKNSFLSSSMLVHKLIIWVRFKFSDLGQN